MSIFENKRILIISAHPDDEVLGCGGILSKYSHRCSATILFIGEGSSCRFANLESKDEITEAINQRKKASKNAMELLDVDDVIFKDLPCGRFDTIPILEINHIIENCISAIKPDIVLTHDEGDVNNDHRIIYRSTKMSTRPNSKCFVPILLSYEVPSSSECTFSENSQFSPNIFEKLSANDIGNKWKALSFYETEVSSFPFPRSEVGLETYARFRGMQIGTEFAEAFRLIRQIDTI